MNDQYDAIILGSGIGGTLLATILARRDIRVALIDREQHPRFAIGEATVPETSLNLKMMSELYEVPEIAHLANFFDLRDQVGPTHGVKKGFTFCHHRHGERHDAVETTQTATLSPPMGPDCHWFRQDTDQYMLTVAARYGARVMQKTQVTDIQVNDDGVVVATDAGTLHGQIVIDGTGAFSPFAKQMGLRENPSRLMTRSRGMFTHMVGVGRYDEVVPRSDHGMPYPIDQTSLHHLFPGGWMWVIPFDNHDQSTNNLCSVGIMYDIDKHPPTDASPQEEFEAFLRNHPSVAEQFANAQVVRKWVSTSRVQYSSEHLYSGRYVLLPHAAAFIDPLFSSGLVLTTHAVNLLGEALIAGFQLGTFPEDGLREYERQMLVKLRVFDRLVATSFKSFASFQLWNAWLRVWEIGTYFNTLASIRCMVRYLQTGHKDEIRARYGALYGKPLAYNVDGYEALMDAMVAAVEAVDSGKIATEDGTRAIYEALGRFDAMPSFITRREPELRSMGSFTLVPLLRMLIWGRTQGPDSARHFYDFSLLTFTRWAITMQWSYTIRHLRKLAQPLQLMWLARHPGRTRACARRVPPTCRSLRSAPSATRPALVPTAKPTPGHHGVSSQPVVVDSAA
jgi:FADH2 O2-dependent halogenase